MLRCCRCLLRCCCCWSCCCSFRSSVSSFPLVFSVTQTIAEWLSGALFCAARRVYVCSLESIKTKLKHLRRGASDESHPLKRRRTSGVLAEIETAVIETPRQTLSVLRRQSSLDMSRSTLWRALHEDLQARCVKPVRAPRLTTENRLARMNFCRDSIRGKRTRMVFSDEKSFRWNCAGLAQNSLTLVIGAHGKPARKAELDPDVCINEHSPTQPRHHGGRRDGDRHRFPAVLIDAHQHRKLHSDAGRRVLATLHGAPWHRHVELVVVAGRQRSITHQPAHQGVFGRARHPAPHVASMLARPQPTRFSPVASVGNGTGRAPVPVPARTARHDRAHTVRSRPRSR